MTLDTDLADGTLTVRISGDLDVTVAYLPYELVVEQFDQHPDIKAVVLDLTDLGFTDSTGIGSIIRIRHHAAEHGASLRLANTPLKFQQLLAMTGLSADLPTV